MAETKGQKRTVERVLHEFKHGELETSAGDKVKSRKQAVAIALSEAGDSNRVTPKRNRHNAAHTKAKERAGQTAQQEKEGKDAMTRSRSELYAEAKKRDIPGRSKMNKAQLEKALGK